MHVCGIHLQVLLVALCEARWQHSQARIHGLIKTWMRLVIGRWDGCRGSTWSTTTALMWTDSHMAVHESAGSDEIIFIQYLYLCKHVYWESFYCITVSFFSFLFLSSFKLFRSSYMYLFSIKSICRHLPNAICLAKLSMSHCQLWFCNFNFSVPVRYLLSCLLWRLYTEERFLSQYRLWYVGTGCDMFWTCELLY